MRLARLSCEESELEERLRENQQLINARLRENLPNPHMDDENPYVPTNMPAIGDLFDLFHFGAGDHRGDGDDRG